MGLCKNQERCVLNLASKRSVVGSKVKGIRKCGCWLQLFPNYLCGKSLGLSGLGAASHQRKGLKYTGPRSLHPGLTRAAFPTQEDLPLVIKNPTLSFLQNPAPSWLLTFFSDSDAGVLCQHSEVVLWNLLSIQMIFWWICGEESGLPILFLCHLGTAHSLSCSFFVIYSSLPHRNITFSICSCKTVRPFLDPFSFLEMPINCFLINVLTHTENYFLINSQYHMKPGYKYSLAIYLDFSN